MTRVRNILFIMCDQLRRDYLGCYGHPSLRTPNIDALAQRGTRFARCYVQGPVCGPSRMSTYTGRYVASHGASWNFVPLSAHLPTIGEHLRACGLRTAVVGKTHVVADREGLRRMGLDPAHGPGRLIGEGGFEPFARHDGVITEGKLAQANPPYNAYLQHAGHAAHNAWHDYANAAEGPDGTLLSGWSMRHARRPARVAEHHGETAWATDEALRFIHEQGDAPWCLHLSYIKPHWPYMAPAPYHEAYGPADVQPAVRSARERDVAHPVVQAFREHAESLTFARDEVRLGVIPTYMGLVQQIDDHMGRLMRGLQQAGRHDDTLVVFTSDHGDMLGDHWLGEKELFYEASAAVPLIIAEPAASMPGQVRHDLVEAIDLLPTFIDAVGGEPEHQWLEGESLLPLVRGTGTVQREAAFSELDYGFYPAARALGLSVNDARATMACTTRWKYIDYLGFAPQLFDLREDPQELVDRGPDPSLAGVRSDMADRLRCWRTHLRSRTTLSDTAAAQLAMRRNAMREIVIGAW